MVLILLLAFAALFFYQWKSRGDDVFEAFAESLVLFAVLLLAITNVLSFFSACTRADVFVSWLIVTLVTAAAYAVRFGFALPAGFQTLPGRMKKRLSRASLPEKVMLFFCLILCVILFVGALFTVPHNYDSMTYHLGRVAHWIDQRSVRHFVTNIDRQLYSPVLAEYYLLHIMLLTGSDSFVNLLQYASMLVCAAFLYKCSRLLNTSRAFCVLAVFLFLTMPLTISQSVTTQNDLFAASIFAMFLYYFLWFIKRNALILDREEVRRLIIIGILVGLAYITKTSVCASMVMFMPWLLITRLRKKDSHPSLVKAAGIALLSLLAVISESLIRNYLSSGTVIPKTASSNIMVATKNVSYIIVNILKNFALLSTQHLSDALNGFICRIAIHTGALLQVEVNNEAISFHGFDFIQHMNRGDNMYSHDVTPSAFVTYLSVVCGVFLIALTVAYLLRMFRGKLHKAGDEMSDAQATHSAQSAADIPASRGAAWNGAASATQIMDSDDAAPASPLAADAGERIGFGISAWLSLGFIMALLRWQPWGTRLMYPALAMMVVMITNMFDFCLIRAKTGIRQGLIVCLAALSVLLCLPSLAYNIKPSLENLSDGCSHRLERYFTHNKRYGTYEELAGCVASLHPSEEPFTVGVNISGDGYDYPLWLVFRDRLPQVTLQHLRMDAPELVPDAPQLLLWVEKDELEVGDIILYGDRAYECVFVSQTEYKDAVLSLAEE